MPGRARSGAHQPAQHCLALALPHFLLADSCAAALIHILAAHGTVMARRAHRQGTASVRSAPAAHPADPAAPLPLLCCAHPPNRAALALESCWVLPACNTCINACQ